MNGRLMLTITPRVFIGAYHDAAIDNYFLCLYVVCLCPRNRHHFTARWFDKKYQQSMMADVRMRRYPARISEQARRLALDVASTFKAMPRRRARFGDDDKAKE